MSKEFELMDRILLLFIIFLLGIESNAQQEKLYQISDGISGIEYTFCKDRKGFLWIGTSNGLHSFDGNDFKVFKHVPSDSTSLSSNLIESIFEDSKGRLWVGTNNDLQLLDRNTNRLQSFPVFFNSIRRFIKFNDIAEDKKGNIWIATNFGLLKIDNKNRHQFYLYEIDEKGDLLKSNFNSVLVDSQDNVWVGSFNKGLYFLNPRLLQIKHFSKESKENFLQDETVLSLCFDAKKNLLIGTQKNGIYLYDPRIGKLKNLPVSSYNEPKKTGGIVSMALDKSGTVWVGTERNGLKKIDQHNVLINADLKIRSFDINESKVHCFIDETDNLWLGIDFEGLIKKNVKTSYFNFISYNGPESKSLSYPLIKSIFQDSYGDIWIGTDGGGLNHWRKKSDQIIHYKSDQNKSTSLADNAVLSICEDGSRNLWIATYVGGLSMFNRKDNSFINYPLPQKYNLHEFQFIKSITPDGDKGLWLGMNGGVLRYFDIQTRKFNNFGEKIDPIVFKEIFPYVKSLLLDTQGTLWFGTYNGLFAWIKGTSKIKRYPSSNDMIENQEVNCIHEDKAKNIWFGTSSGLHVINRENNQITTYSNKNGLPNNSVQGILEDEIGNLWVSTANGLSKFSKNRALFRNYFKNDGLPSNEFLSNAQFRSKNGILYFGTTSGMVYFLPENIPENSKTPNLALTELKLFNEVVPVGRYKDGRRLLTKVLNETKSLTLSYSDNNFMIGFAAIDFEAPEEIRYAYQLEGFDKDWIYTDHNRRYSNYTNLDPGKYIFKVKCTNSSGIWSKDIRSVAVLVNPPLYRTWWAYCIYMFLIIGLIYGLHCFGIYRINMKQALELETLQRRKIEEINEAKMQFFSNISHEFRTPISLIFAHLERLLKIEENPSSRTYIKIVQEQGTRLLRLVNQLLDVQKVEDQQLNLRAHQGDIIRFIKKIKASFDNLANQEGKILDLDAQYEEVLIWFDPDLMEKILLNLISNAFKCTSNGQSIIISIAISKLKSAHGDSIEFLDIKVSDTGIGIPEEFLERIFDRFYQVPDQQSAVKVGTGIGLHLAKKLVELHRGELYAESIAGEGSIFTVRLPFGNSHLLDKEIVEYSEIFDMTDSAASLAGGNLESEEEYINAPAIAQGISTVLIIEDDLEIRRYIAEELQHEAFAVMQAGDGKTGLELAQENLPDLIICDITMPELNGMEVLRLLRLDFNTAHIPVILLTAKGAIEDKIEGVGLGADDYISKPFNTSYLKMKVKRLIDQRRKLKERFSRTISFNAKEMTITSADERFLQKAMDYVKEKISDPEMNIEEMGKDIGVSRVHLYRKLKSLTGQSPTEFVRIMRLKQAAHLLAQNKFSISEVAYSVGFNSLQYFSNSFHDYFQVSPSAYSQRKTENNNE